MKYWFINRKIQNMIIHRIKTPSFVSLLKIKKVFLIYKISLFLRKFLQIHQLKKNIFIKTTKNN